MSMEWVETTGRTVEEAKEAALDQLGVDERDAEFSVVEEPKSGLFGRVRQEARVRARIRPDKPRPKADRRDRRRREPLASTPAPTGNEAEAPSPPVPSASHSSPLPTTRPVVPPAVAAQSMADELTPEEQAEDATLFLEGLAEAFDVDGTVETEMLENDVVEARLEGDGLALLIGPKGQTLTAIQDLARAAVQRGSRGRTRLRIDIGGYQRLRRAALERFARSIAEQVQTSGMATALEPMPPADRKVVHDTINTIEGVTTRSEGEDAHRRVLILPA